MELLGGAGLDVFEFEPKLHRALRKHTAVITTPHIASARHSVREAMAKKVVDTITAVDTGAPIKNLAQ